ncbi:ATP-binding cassette domain-containing protein [Promicromonospora iranensis]|uniref:ABC-type multidrug transport system fused ATPase/permease subunit n=1 Tax=Promicromonospora iranensis TaxID=1105144 RepID=A0ABU2CMK5_9MICO|nr:ATP-binding cassette domain-containing protein [Promicromonospora iranensis]MDR7382412.1 ABC-type multidrug transport system fused ATPase/permease subunit [Promicromonospora iranensis]
MIDAPRTPDTTPSAEASPPPAPALTADPTRRLDWRRLRGAAAVVALLALTTGAVGQALGTVAAGQLAADATLVGLVLLAVCVVGGALFDGAGQVVWASVVDRAEGRLRSDLLSAALRQPLATLSEQAVGEVLDRVDDDTHAVGTLVRRQLWGAGRTVVGVVPMWIIAGVTWWPAWFLFPVLGGIVALLTRPLLGEISRRKVIEEAAWTDHAAAFEEAVAARNDLRTSLGQAFAVRRVAQLSAVVHSKFKDVVRVEETLLRRAGLVMYALLAGTAVVCAVVASGGGLSVDQLVTLFLITAMFVGQMDNLVHHLPDIQEGLGAVLRIRQMLAVEPEPDGGDDLPDGPLGLEVRDLTFAYAEGTFALRGVDLSVPAGQTIALVGRTGSGKSTLAALMSRAVEPEPGSVFLGGADVRDLDLQKLRGAVGVVTQRTEIIAGTLAENIALFADVPRADVEGAVRELGLTDWVAGMPDGLETLLGPGGTTLSAGEEQLVAFARLLVRDVQLVVLDEATARMDPLTEARVVAASDRLLTGRTGVLIAHRLGTIERADLVAVLDHGRVVQQGRRAELARVPGPFRTLLVAGASDGSLDGAPAGAKADDAVDVAAETRAQAVATPDRATAEPDPAEPDPADLDPATAEPDAVGGRRRAGTPPDLPEPGVGPSLARGVLHALFIRPKWGLFGALLFLLASLVAAQGALTGFLWGRTVEQVGTGELPVDLLVALAVLLLLQPLFISRALGVYPRWWVEVLLRIRMSVMHGQTRQYRLPATPPGEVVARSMDADRFVRYADRWVDFVNGLAIVAVTALISGTWTAGAVLLAVMVVSALASAIGRPIAGRSAAGSSAARARFGRALVSALDSARTVKLAARTPDVRRHLGEVDAGRVNAAIFEHRVQAVLDSVPLVTLYVGVVAAWTFYLTDRWDLATTLLVASAVMGFAWFGVVAGAVVTEAPGTRAWQVATARFAGGADLVSRQRDVDLVTGTAPAPEPTRREPLDRLQLHDLTAVHDDGTIGVSDVDLEIRRGELVLLLGQVGSGKSSLLSALAGLMEHTGEVRWNGTPVTDAQVFLRPGQVAHVAQVPRVLSGTFSDNVRLDHARDIVGPVQGARLSQDMEEAGGPHALVGHRGVRLSGGQVQRLALARALAADTELLLADDVSSALDASTEIELWTALRQRGTTVVGATSKRAALARADRVVVLVDGKVADVGPWSGLAPRWSHLAG